MGSILEVVQRYVTMTPLTWRPAGTRKVTPIVWAASQSKTFLGICPFHEERTPSFHVNTSVEVFHCFGCGLAGDETMFLRLIEKHKVKLKEIA